MAVDDSTTTKYIRSRIGIAAHKISALGRGNQGALLVEVLVAVMVFTVVGTAVLGALSTVRRSSAQTERQAIAENLARNQIENTLNFGYQAPPGAYPTIASPEGYTVDTQAVELIPGDSNVEKVITTVSLNGAPIVVVDTLRTNR